VTFRRLVAGLVLIFLMTIGHSAFGTTAADLRRAVDIQKRITALLREQAAITTELSRLDQAIPLSISDVERISLEAERRLFQAGLDSNTRERDTLRAEFEALPPLARQQATAPVGAVGPLDPEGLRPLAVNGDQTAAASASAFNPAISVIPDVAYFRDNRAGASSGLVDNADGFPIVHAEGDGHEGLQEGFNLRETELAFTAAVDPYFEAAVLLSIHGDGIEAEEIYFQTRGLPAGLQVRGGKFLSGIGYINRQHPHQWDFVDQNLAYTLLLGAHGLSDTGVQVSWLPVTPFYVLFGGELLQGTNEKLANYIGEEEFPGAGPDDAPRTLSYRAGPRLFTGFVKLSPNLGDLHAMQVGMSVAASRTHQEVHDDDADGVPESVLDGTARLWGLDFVYKYDSPRQYGAGDVTLQSEYLYRRRDVDVLSTPFREISKNDGFYLQGVYGLFPRWQVAGRAAAAGLTNTSGDGTSSLQWNTSVQYSEALTFNPTEFSRLRMQFNQSRVWVGGVAETFHEFFVQFQMSIGAHGAHRF
jgi:hypothetical protein